MAVAHQVAGRRAEAADLYRAVLAVRPGLPTANHNLALLEIDDGQPGSALERVNAALAAVPDQPVFQNTQGSALTALGRLDEAVVAFRRAADLDPAYARPRANLGTVLARLGRHGEAATAYREALAVEPHHADAWRGLQDALVAAGDRDGMRETLEAYLRRDPSDRLGARTMLAAHGFAALPDRASPAQMTGLYAARAQAWDTMKSVYFAADLVAEAAEQAMSPGGDVLDLGCGTGLVGERLRPICARLEGVDLSADMLRIAQEKGVYDHLQQADIIEYLRDRPGRYDAITCAATLIHFGDLAPAFAAVARALRPGGVFALTLFPNTEAPEAFGMALPHNLAQGGVFRHGADYVVGVSAGAGLDAVRIEQALHEIREGEPVTGLLVVCRQSGPT